MKFDLIDRVVEISDDRIVTLKCVTSAEEYLADHFPTFPVLPGVMMLEAMVQAARRLLERVRPDAPMPFVLGRVRALKYSRLVSPGDTLRIEAVLVSIDNEEADIRGKVVVVPGDFAAASGRLVIRPARVQPAIMRPNASEV